VVLRSSGKKDESDLITVEINQCVTGLPRVPISQVPVISPCSL